jgi:hypothetical protein
MGKAAGAYRISPPVIASEAKQSGVKKKTRIVSAALRAMADKASSAPLAMTDARNWPYGGRTPAERS